MIILSSSFNWHVPTYAVPECCCIIYVTKNTGLSVVFLHNLQVPWHVPCGGVCYGDGNLVFIANDWHTALLPVYLKAYYRDNGIMQYTRSVLVIHNIAHQVFSFS